MRRLRRCDSRCHDAQKPKCSCWCNGAFHGKAGEMKRQILHDIASDPVMLQETLGKFGFKQGLTKYVSQLSSSLIGGR